jgi:cytochrome c oxidase subunit IV
MEHNAAQMAENHGGGTKEVIRVTIILSVITLIELALGYAIIGMPPSTLVTAVKGSILILMMAKAFYIVAYFMHLKHELKNMIMTIVVPLALFIWFITAFLWDGNSYKNLRNTYDRHHAEQNSIKVEKKEHSSGEKQAQPSGDHKGH